MTRGSTGVPMRLGRTWASIGNKPKSSRPSRHHHHTHLDSGSPTTNQARTAQSAAGRASLGGGVPGRPASLPHKALSGVTRTCKTTRTSPRGSAGATSRRSLGDSSTPLLQDSTRSGSGKRAVLDRGLTVHQHMDHAFRVVVRVRELRHITDLV